MGEQVIFHPDFFVIPEKGEKPYLIAFQCEECGKSWFPKLPYCPNCWSDKLVKKPLSQRGKLYTYTVIYTPQPGLKAPIVFGFVDFAEEGVRVGAQIEMEVEKIQEIIKIGMEMEVTAGVIREDSDGKQTIGYKFVPVA